MKFKVSNKIRGTIVLPTVGYALKPGQMISIAEDQSQATDILIAISRGFIEEYDDTLKIEDVKQEPQEQDDGKLDLTKPKEAKLEFEEETQKEIEIEKKESNMMSYDLETKTILNKDDSRRTAMDRISSVDAEPVQSGAEINFEDEKTEKPKPRKMAAKKKAKKKTSKKTKKAKSTKSIKQQIDKVAAEVKKTIKPVGKVKEPQADNLLIYDNSEEISFVNEEQEQKRIQQHPILSKKVNED